MQCCMTLQYTTLHYTTHYITLHYTSRADCASTMCCPKERKTGHATPPHLKKIKYNIHLRLPSACRLVKYWTASTTSHTQLHEHYTTLHYYYHTILHYTTLHYATQHYTTLHYDYIVLQYTTLHYTTLHYTT